MTYVYFLPINGYNISYLGYLRETQVETSFKLRRAYQNQMAKKVKVVVKINLQAGAATPAPPVGTALGQHGVAIMDFVKQYNDKTKDMKGQVAPAVITIYEDRSFTFIH